MLLFSQLTKTQKPLRQALLLLLLGLTAGISQAQTIRYVKPSATGTGDGSSWANASADLQGMINASGTNQIWVAAGTYYPTTNPTDRNASFVMKNGVAIYGGFAGTETNLNDRNWITNSTILSGDIDHATDPLVVTGSGSTLRITGNSGNSYHVIFNDNNGLNSTAVLDGFTITGGYASDYGGGMYNNSSSPSIKNCSFSGNLASSGGGMYNNSSSPSLSNCSFSSNGAGGGGGMCNNSSSPSLSNCSFSSNGADGGGGMYNNSSSPSLSNCSFTDNYGSRGGGGTWNSRSSPSLVNCSFSKNNGGSDFGGGMYNSGSSLSLINCSFLGNQARNGGGISNESLLSSNFTNCIFVGNQARGGGGMWNDRSSPSLVNCGFSGNMANAGGGMYNYSGSFPSLKNCILWGNSSEVDNQEGTPYFTESSPTYTKTLVKGLALESFQGTEDPLFVNQPAVGLGTTGDLRLQSCSPVLNAGNNAANTSTTDLDGNNRYFGVIDLGAYEYQANAVGKPTATAGTTKPTICLGSNLALTASGGNAFSWNGPVGSNFSSTAQNPSSVASSMAFMGVYSVTVSNVNCQFTATATVSVQVNPSITVSVSFAPICLQGNPLSLSASGGSEYRWRGPNGFSSTSATPSKGKTVANDEGVYSITVTGNGVCTVTSTLSVYFGIGSGGITIANHSPYCKGGPIILTATASGGSSYRWTKQFGSGGFAGNPVTITNRAKTSDGGVYTVFVTGQNGCIEKQESLVTVSPVACVGTRLASEEAEEIDMEINAYPNPVTHTLTVEVRLKEPSKLSLSLFNSIGKERGSWQLNEETSVHKTELNLSDLQGGVYLLQAQAGRQKVVKRVVKIQY